MVTISHLVKKIVNEKPFLQEALAQKIISYGNLAEQLTPKIEEDLGKKIKHSAAVMALRRYSDELKDMHEKVKPFDYRSEIVMKTNICDINVVKSPKLMTKLNKLYGFVDFEKGDILNVIIGNFEISIVTNEKYKDKVIQFLKGEKIVKKESNLVALTIRFGSSEFFNTPGVVFTIIRKLAWENINIYEIVSTMTELTLILDKKNSMKAYDGLQSLMVK
ncbi:hypothetical protein J4209_04460 [Candidatus Woesearchaeota archaeon]|nr:hypothetical protein [Candidatus Woesearchaeota archaeon]